METYTYDAANRLINVGGVAHTWDKNGNLKADGSATYGYDFENRLISTTLSGVNTRFAYAEFGYHYYVLASEVSESLVGGITSGGYFGIIGFSEDFTLERYQGHSTCLSAPLAATKLEGIPIPGLSITKGPIGPSAGLALYGPATDPSVDAYDVEFQTLGSWWISMILHGALSITGPSSETLAQQVSNYTLLEKRVATPDELNNAIAYILQHVPR